MLVEEYLGRSFPAFGKAPVMELSTKSRPPKFSRRVTLYVIIARA